jgi:cytochrome c
VQECDLFANNSLSHPIDPRPAVHAPASRKRFLLVSVLAAIVGITGLGLVHPVGNLRAETGRGLDEHLVAANMPVRATAVSIAKCADCYLIDAGRPFYAVTAPESWLIESDIGAVRRLMDLSLWDELATETRQSLVARMILNANSGKMPPLRNLLMQWGVRPLAPEVQALASTIDTSDEKSLAGPGDATRGKMVFEKRCSICHSMTKNQQGPQLAGLLGRKAGSVARFQYSSALRKSGLTWTEETLDKWLTAPDTLVPDTAMDYRVRDAEERRDLIAYMRR